MKDFGNATASKPVPDAVKVSGLVLDGLSEC